MTQKDPIWPMRELMGYRRLVPAPKRLTPSPETSGARAIETLERRSMISGPMSIVLAAAMAPACETHLAFEASDEIESPESDGTVAALADGSEANCNALAENPGDAYDDAASKCQPDVTATPETRTFSEVPRTYTLATIKLPMTHHVRHAKNMHDNDRVGTAQQAQEQPALALQIMASGVAIDFDQATEISAMLNHPVILPGVVFNPIAGIAALVA